ncbi:hypothetical protein FRC01_008808 [Tulasnella sp. 417]|nr:hypothetical protein FRC01_008808 [Tulasnella sp. 417]
MPPRFRVLAGPSYDSLSPLPVNTDSTDSSAAFTIKTPYFEGRIIGNIKGFVDDAGEVVTSKYFENEDRRKDGVTWSIQIQGRFLESISANDVMFGNTFDRPLKLPWGTAAALQFAHYIDPVLTEDLTGSKPWALSPAISTMPHITSMRHPRNSPLQSFNPIRPFVTEDIRPLLNGTTTPPSPPGLTTASKRKKYFEKEARRKAVTYGPDVVLHMDFCYGYFQFPELVLAIPGGITFDLKKYWDRQPVRFVCCRRGEEGKGPGQVFFAVQFEVPEYEEGQGPEPAADVEEEREPTEEDKKLAEDVD